MSQLYETYRKNVKLGPGQGLRFTRGRGYYAGREPLKAAAAPAPVDPLAPLTEAQIRRRATTDVRSQVDPLIAAITARINARAKAGAGAITGYTNQAASQLGGYADKARGIYADAQASQAGSDAALSQVLSGQGTELAAALAAKLGAAGINVPQVEQQVQQTGQGSAGALYGSGSASLSDLIGRGAGTQEYAAKLPGIARLGGLQSIRQLQLKSQADLAAETGAITSQVPGQITQAITKYRGDELDKTFAREANRTKAQVAQANAVADRAAAVAKAREKQADLTYKYDALNATQQRAATAEAGRNARAAATRAAAAKKAAATKAAKAKGTTGKLTANQVLAKKGTAATIAENAYKGFTTTDKDGVPTQHPQIGYQAALDEMRKEGIPLPIAQQALNRWYHKKERGRPELSYQERQALKRGKK